MDFESGNKRPRVVYMSAAQSARTLMDTALSMAFNTIIFMFVASAAASIFGIPAVFETARAQNIAVRREYNASLNTYTCGLYFGRLTEEEKVKAHAVDAHLINHEFCNVAQAYMNENHAIQVTRRMLNHYALCESGKCDEFLHTAANNAMWITLGGIAIFLFLSFAFGKKTPSFTEEMLHWQQMQTGLNKKRHYD